MSHQTNRDDPADAESELDFTTRANELFLDTVDHPNFQSEDQMMIYRTLLRKVKPVRFGHYLRRYLYRKAELTGVFTEIPLRDYQDIICAEFADRGTPCSFAATKATLRQLSKNWLEQQTVSRQVVLLLGFGLGMSVSDVDSFLLKGLHEAQLNAKDPLEVICWYCYANGYGFAKYEVLWEQYVHQPQTGDALLENTLQLRGQLRQVRNERQLMAYLSVLPVPGGAVRQSVAVRRQFERLYGEACRIVAGLYTETAADTARIHAARAGALLERNARLRDDQKQEIIRRERDSYQRVRASDIGPGELEQVLFAAIPRDRHGNMLPMKASALKDQFNGKRLTRQHMAQILAGKENITRYDLLTLHFFVFAHDLDRYGTINARYDAFVKSANRVLLAGGMGEYYVANPYECFLLMCIIAQDPLGTFADVWELSYQGAEGE
ncbi:MAG: hypothetical protein ACI4MG_07375 [Aristaeellaceae bacterium]